MASVNDVDGMDIKDNMMDGVDDRWDYMDYMDNMNVMFGNQQHIRCSNLLQIPVLTQTN